MTCWSLSSSLMTWNALRIALSTMAAAVGTKTSSSFSSRTGTLSLSSSLMSLMTWNALRIALSTMAAAVGTKTDVIDS